MTGKAGICHKSTCTYSERGIHDGVVKVTYFKNPFTLAAEFKVPSLGLESSHGFEFFQVRKLSSLDLQNVCGSTQVTAFARNNARRVTSLPPSLKLECHNKTFIVLVRRYNTQLKKKSHKITYRS
jgi:hypothetical protein